MTNKYICMPSKNKDVIYESSPQNCQWNKIDKREVILLFVYDWLISHFASTKLYFGLSICNTLVNNGNRELE